MYYRYVRLVPTAFLPCILTTLIGTGCGSRTALDVVSHPEQVDAGTPVDAASPFAPYAVGFFGACFLEATGSVGCFVYPDGGNSESELAVTLDHIPGVRNATQIAGEDPFCARLDDGTVTCWTMENGGTGGIFPASPVANLDHVAEVDVSDGYGCAVRDDGSVWCWGEDTYNNLGLGNACPTSNPDCDAETHAPGPVVDVTGAQHVTINDIDACARTTLGSVYCWGRVGVGDTASYPIDRSVPIEIPAAQGALSLAMSEGDTIATLSDALVVFGHPFGAEAPDAPTPIREPRATGEQVYGNRYDTFCTKSPATPLHCTGGMSLDGATIGTSDFDVPGTEAAIDVSLAVPAGCARMTASDFVCWGQPFGGVTPVHVE